MDESLLAQHRQKYSTAIAQAQGAGSHAFQAWFNREGAQTRSQCLARGYWDFALHILTPRVCAALAQPERQHALEIGSGGGRLLNAACRFFGEVTGVDIHNEQDSVAAFLRSQGHRNMRLLRGDGATLAFPSRSVDFIYSFIVFQHFPSYEVFVAYMREIQRCLRTQGVAQIYFGAFRRLHPLYQLVYWRQGYRAQPGRPANDISLVVRTRLVRRLCQRLGLRVIDSGPSYYLAPDGYPRCRGGQQYVTLVKC